MSGTLPAVTGLGVVAPTGLTVDGYWKATLAGRSGVRPITRFDASRYPTRLAGQVDGFDPDATVPKRLQVQTDVGTHYGLAAAAAALDSSGVDLAAVPAYRRGVVTASSSGGVLFGQREMTNLWAGGPEQVGAYQSIAWFYAATTGQLSIAHGMQGQSGVLCTEQAGGLDALGQSRRLLRDGTAVVLTGGYDCALSPYGLVCLMTGGRLSTGDDPATAYLPFDRRAAGHVPGEGAAMLVVEPHEAAAAAGRPVYGVLRGYAATFDPAPGSGRPPALRNAVDLALLDAGLEPDDVDAVFADGAGSRDQDLAEANALADLFGPYGVPVTVPKAATGRMYAAGAALDVVTALLALRDQVLPPTPAAVRPDADYLLDVVHGVPRPRRLRHVVVLARGLGGFNAAVVLSAPGARR